MTRTEIRKEWKAKVDAYRSSGQKTTQWCIENDVKQRQLWYWLRKFKTNRSEVKSPVSSKSKWVSVEVDKQSAKTKDILLVRVGAASIEVTPNYDPALLSDVVKTLRSLC